MCNIVIYIAQQNNFYLGLIRRVRTGADVNTFGTYILDESHASTDVALPAATPELDATHYTDQKLCMRCLGYQATRVGKDSRGRKQIQFGQCPDVWVQLREKKRLN